MNMVTIVCPKCGAEAKLSLVDTSYVGPRRCWKCHEFFTITIRNNRVESCEPLSQEEYERQQEAKNAKGKLGNFMETSHREEPDIPQLTPERRRDYSKPLSYEQTPNKEQSTKKEEPDIPQLTPERRRDYSKPLSYGTSSGETPTTSKAAPERPAPKTPPDRFRTFVPLESPSQEEPEKPAPKTKPDRFRTFIPPAT